MFAARHLHGDLPARQLRAGQPIRTEFYRRLRPAEQRRLLRGIAVDHRSDADHIFAQIAWPASRWWFLTALLSACFVFRIRWLLPWLRHYGIRSRGVIFILLWATIVYNPITHWLWGNGGFLKNMGALDFAGGAVVHINAGMTALAAALILGKRQGYPAGISPPHNLPFAALARDCFGSGGSALTRAAH